MNNNPYCKCGCGQKVKSPKNKYIWGHNAKDRIVSEETKKKQSNRMKGKTYEELYGVEKAKKVKEKIGKKSKEQDRFKWLRGRTWEEIYGEDKCNELKQNLSEKKKNDPKLKNRIGKNNPNYKGCKDSLYSAYSSRLNIDECRENKNGKIEVKCTYCNQWFTPTQVELDNRINELKRGKTGTNFYCSNNCKKECPIHYQVLWPKNYKPYDNKYLPDEVSSELRKMVFERDNWTCQKCESNEKLHCHHIDPKTKNPMFANDMDSCITLCKECHKFIHTEIEGCKYNELSCK